MKQNILLMTLLLLLSVLKLSAQVTSSSMTGMLKDDKGEPLIGAIVEATHLPSGTLYITSTQGDGRYNISNMRVGGPYKITTSYIGYTAEPVNDIYLSLGQPFALNITMHDASVDLGLVEIVGTNDPLINSQRTGASTNLNSATINALPTINRNINDFTRMSPQSNGTSFAGRDNRFNNYTIDGNIYNNNFGLGSGQFAGTNPLSLDAIDEVQVNLAPYDVRQGGFTGANVNAVTRSGTNNWEGSVYTYLRNDQLIGDRIGDLRLNRGESQNLIYGARLGGPIIKNRLFFFASVEKETEQVPALQKVASRDGLAPDGLTVSRVPADRLEFVRGRMIDLYGYDPGEYENYPFASEALRINFRLDYNISRNHKAFVRYNRYSGFTDVTINGNSIRFLPNSQRFSNTNRFGIEAMNFRNSHYTNDINVNSLVGELNSTFGSRFSNSFNVGLTMIEDPRRGIPGGQAFPFIEVMEQDAGGNPLYYMTLGNELFSVGNLLENRIFNITNNTSMYLGRHTLTAGVNFEYMTFDNAFNPVFNGFYRYSSYDDFVRAVIDRDPNQQPAAFAQGYSFSGGTEPPTDQTRFAQLGIYIQDEYQVNERLRLTGGLRVDLPFYPIDLPVNDKYLGFTLTDPRNQEQLVPDVSVLPRLRPLFSPRIGFNYDVLGDRTLQVRGGTGMFSGRLPFVWLSNQINGNGVTRGGYGLYTAEEFAANPRPFNPDVNAYRPDPATLESQLSNEVNFTDRNFKLPQVWRSNLAVDYKLPLGIIATVEGIYTRDLSTPIAMNLVLPEADGVLTGPDPRPTYSTITNNPQFNQAFYLTNAEANGDYMAATVQLQKAFDNGFTAMAAYTASRARDYGLEGGSQAISLWPVVVKENRNDPEISYTRFDKPNRVVGMLSYTTGNSTVSLFYDGGEAGRYSYTYSYRSSNLSNTFAGANLLMYVPLSADELNFEEFTAGGRTITQAEQRAALDEFIDQDAYLSGMRGKIADRNGAKLPWVNRFDLRLLQDIKLTKGKHRLQISLDIMNVGNLIFSEWGVEQVAVQSTPLSYAGKDADNRPIYRMNFVTGTSEFPTTTFRPVATLSQTWRAQLGLRYIF